MKNYLLATLVIATAASCSHRTTPTTANAATIKTTEATAKPSPTPVVTPAVPAPNPVALFGANCARCHGGTGIEGAAPRLNQPMAKDEIISVINNGAGSMPRFAEKLSAQEIDAIANFVVSLQPTK